MNLFLFIAICIGILGIFFFLSSSHETRASRWPKIIFSIPFVLIILGAASVGVGLPGGIGIIFSIAFLAFIWCGNIAWLLSGSVVNFLHRDISSPTGMRPDFRFAKNHRRDGELKLALTSVQHELKKDPLNYEGLLLCAGIYGDLKMPNEAAAQLEIILNNPDASDAQKEVARAQKANCEILRRHLEAANLASRKLK